MPLSKLKPAANASFSRSTEGHEIFFSLPASRRASYLKHYPTKEERKDIITQCGDAALLMYEYFLRLGSANSGEITDERTAEYFGWHPTKARRVRQLLRKHGYYARRSTTINKKKNIKTITYYLGKEPVAHYKQLKEE